MPVYSLEIALVTAGMVLLLLEAFVSRRTQAWIGWAAMGICAVVFAGLFVVERPAALYWGFYAADGPALFFKGLALLGTLLVTLISLEYAPVVESYRDGPAGRRGLGEFYCLPLFICAGLMWMASMTDLIGIFVSLEMVTVTFYIMVAYMRRNVGSLEAGVKYLILGALSTGFLVYGIAWLLGTTGQTSLAAMGMVLAGWQGEQAPVLFGMALVLAGMAFKVGAVPLHFWIPDVYQGAPTPVTAFLSVGSKSAGFIVLMRLLEPMLASPMRGQVLLLVGAMAGATLLVGNLAAILQTNFKRLLAYSSISHAGFLLLALAAGEGHGSLTPLGVVSFYLATYLLMTLLCFLVLAVVRRSDGGEELANFDGLGRRSPLLAFALLVGMASLAGVPLTAGFLGKFFAVMLAAGARQWALLVLAVVGAAAGFYYYFKVVRSMYWNEAPPQAGRLQVSGAVRVAAVALVVSILLFGVFPRPIFALLE